MLKTKKTAMPLHHPSRCDEWRPILSHVPHKSSTLTLPLHVWPLFTSNSTILRLQLRYQKYQENVRLFVKKVDSQHENEATILKSSGRTMTVSSLSFVVAVNACKDEKTSEMRTHVTKQGKKNLFVQCQTETELWKQWNQNGSKTGWKMRKTGDKGMRSEEMDLQYENEDERKDYMVNMTSQDQEKDQNAQLHEKKQQLVQDTDANAFHGRRHCYVDVMEPSWLLASIEQRCAETTGLVVTQRLRQQQKRTLMQQVVDVRLAVVDVLFICRAGVGLNLLGRPPSSVDTHCRNTIHRIKKGVTANQGGTELTPADLMRATRIFESLKSDMLMPAVRCLGWLLTKTWRLLFHGLHVDLESLHHVRRVVETSKGEVSVVFAPTHKSHLDYLIISYLCFAYGIPLPRIAAGNNLDLPLVGSFLRANGSFFIRRSFQNDRLYKEVLEQYVHELLYDGNPVEVFIEGGRSRHGRVCKPRLGFMSILLNYVKRGTPHSAYNDDAAENDEGAQKTILVVPISLDYDKVYEADGYANQLLGKPKEKESLAVLLRSVWDLFFLRLGHSYVRFGEPVLLTKTSCLHESSELVAERMQSSGTITSTAIVSALLMWKRTYVTEKMLEIRTLWLVEELEKRGATVAHMECSKIVAHALSILKVDMKANRVVVPQLQHPVRALELGFYRNHLLHIFLPDMAVIGALDAALRQRMKCNKGYSTQYKVDIEAVQAQAKKIWHFLRHICRHEAIDIQARLIQFLADASTCETDASLATVRIDVTRWKTEKLTSFVLSLNWSFMDSLWLTCQGLWCLYSGKEGDNIELAECDVVRRVQVLARELFCRQQLFHAEALCIESIKQSLDFLAESDVVCLERSSDGKSRVVRLCMQSTETKRVLDNLTHEINARRKPHSFLWRDDELPCNLTYEEAMKLMENAEKPQSIYAKWMTPSRADSV